MPQLDQTYAQAYSDMLDDGFDVDDFLDTYRAALSTYTNVDLIAELNEVQGTWESHDDDLEKVCETEVGCRIFGFAADCVQNRKIGRAINEALELAFGSENITDLTIKKFDKLALEKLSFVDEATRRIKRLTNYSYLNETFPREVGNMTQEIRERRYLFTLERGHGRRTANGCRMLPVLFNEMDIVENPNMTSNFDVAPNVLDKIARVRTKCNSMLAKEKQTNSVYVLELLENPIGIPC